MNTNHLKIVASALIALTLSSSSLAHFLYATATPTEGVFEFAESPGDDQLDDLAGKLEVTKFMHFPDLGTKSTALKPASLGHVSTVPIQKGIVAADLVYGILDRSEAGRGVFRLEYFAKGTQTWKQAESPIGQQYEILLKKVDSRILITPVVAGKPIPSDVIIYRRGKTEETLKFTSQPLEIAAKDLTAVRATHAIEKSGELEGKKYDLIRQYATITTPAEADVPAGGDINAWHLLKEAHDARESLQDAIASIAGQITVESKGQSKSVPFIYSFTTGLDIPGNGELPDEDAIHQIESIFTHRRGRAFALGDGQKPTIFTGDTNTNGIQIALQDSTNGSYRVKDNVITEVRRSTPTGYFIISILETLKTQYNTTLSQLFTVSYYDKTGKIKIVQTFQDSYTNVEGYYLPHQRTITNTTPNGVEKVTLTFSNLALTFNPEK